MTTAALALLMSGAITAPAASASSTSAVSSDEPTLPEAPKMVVSIEKLGKTMRGVRDRTHLLTDCDAGKGGTCSIEKSFTVTRTVQVALGVSKSFVSAELNISSSRSVTISARCTSPVFTSDRQVYKAFPSGSRTWYKIVKTYYKGAASSGSGRSRSR